jgi:bacteriocin biosynthesis cyclodehydratase domain-containing protein
MLAAAGIGLVISTGPTAPGARPARARDAEAAPAGRVAAGQSAGGQSAAGPGARPGRRGSRSPAGADRAAQRVRAPRARSRRPSLVILADSHRRELPAALAEKLVPHMAVSASEAIGIVGPLVLPGRSACLRCLDLTRADRDPAWPLILAQLSAQTGDDPPGCDTVLATTVAAQAAAQALAFIDQDGQAPAVTNGTLELVLPGWQWRRRTWHLHPQCGCRYRA